MNEIIYKITYETNPLSFIDTSETDIIRYTKHGLRFDIKGKHK